jgi:hypothetical protein
MVAADEPAMGTSDASFLPEPARALVQAELQPGESLRWVEQPVPGRMALAALPMVLFAIPWTAFALFWIWGAAQGSADAPGPMRLFPLFGLPFVLIGLGLFTSPFWIMRNARRTVYVVTDRRAIVLGGRASGAVSVRSFEPEKLGDLRREQRADGSGDLVFGQDEKVGSKGRTRMVDYGFLAVRNVREAEEYVRALARRAAPL